MDFENDICHGVHLKFGPLPCGMTWDFEFARWGSWPNAIIWQDYANANAHRSEVCRVPTFAVHRKRYKLAR